MIGISVFLTKPKKVPIEQVFIAPKIAINFDILKSSKVQNLELFPGIDRQFDYQARTASGQDQTGRISAPSEEKAKEILTGLGLSSIVISEPAVGRDDPFSPYYEIKLPAPIKSTPIKKK